MIICGIYYSYWQSHVFYPFTCNYNVIEQKVFHMFEQLLFKNALVSPPNNWKAAFIHVSCLCIFFHWHCLVYALTFDRYYKNAYRYYKICSNDYRYYKICSNNTFTIQMDSGTHKHVKQLFKRRHFMRTFGTQIIDKLPEVLSCR